MAPSSPPPQRQRRWSERRTVRRRPAPARLLTGAVCALAGLLVVVAAANARGTDLRPGRHTDLVSLVSQHARRNTELNREVTGLQTQVDRLSLQEKDGVGPDLPTLVGDAGLAAVRGPAVTVSLTDAPDSVAANGVDPDLLVVHQQDIQAVANALWAGGAEAMTIQGVRVIATTGIKCVGNTVVLHNIPYAPPYVIRAIGDPGRLRRALRTSLAVGVYQQYVQAYGLGYTEDTESRVELPAHQGSVDLQFARPVDDQPR